MKKKKQDDDKKPFPIPKKYIIAGAAALLLATVILLISFLSCRSSAEIPPDPRLEQARSFAEHATEPGVVEVNFLKLDGQGNAVFSGRVTDGTDVLFSCGEMILASDVLKINGAEIADSGKNVFAVLLRLHQEGKILFPGIRPARIELNDAGFRGLVFSAEVTPDAERGWAQIHSNVRLKNADLEITYDPQKDLVALSGSCPVETVINFNGMFGLYQTGKVQSVRMEQLTFVNDRWQKPLSGKLNVTFIDGVTLSGVFHAGAFTGKAAVRQKVYELTVAADGKTVASRHTTDRLAEEKVTYSGNWDPASRAFKNCVIREERSPMAAEPLLFPVSVTGKQWTRVSEAGEKTLDPLTDMVKTLVIATPAYRIDSRELLRTHKTKQTRFSGMTITGKNDSFSLTGFDLETVNGSGKITNAGFCMPAGNKVGTFSGTVKEDLNFTMTLEAKGTLCLTNGVVMKDVVIRLDKNAQITSPARQIRGELKKELPFALPESFSDLQLNGSLNWEYHSGKGLLLSAKDAAVISGKLNMDAEKVNFSLVFSNYSKDQTTPQRQKIVFDSLSVSGYTFGKGAIIFRMGEKFYLEQASAEWCGGMISIFATEFEPGKTIFSADCSNVDLAKFLSQFALGKFSGEGQISGKLQFTIGQNGAPRLCGGALQSAPDKGGVLKSVITDHTVMSSGSEGTQRFALEVLRDMTYAWVICEVRPASADKQTVLMLRFNGKANRDLPYEIDPESGELRMTKETGPLPALRMDVDFNINR